MSDWQSIRLIAREKRAEIFVGNKVMEGLVPADSLMAKALEYSGLQAVSVPAGDTLLAGAQAVLDREVGCIWHNQELSEPIRLFNIAHELGHHVLHEDHASCIESDIVANPIEEPLPLGEAYVMGYSPRQRRETEASVFAAEFLLPGPAIRSAFISGLTSHDIINLTGLSETTVLGQMGESILLDDVEPTAAVISEGPAASSMHQLDASQLQAATLEHGPALVEAGPGTGKTRTLVARVNYLLKKGVTPGSILALTFSNKSAQEMQQRIVMDDPAASILWVGTFHAFGLELIRRFSDQMGLPSTVQMLDTMDAYDLMERHLSRLQLNILDNIKSPISVIPRILSAISRAKDEMISPAMAMLEAEKYAAQVGCDDDQARKGLEMAGAYGIWQQILQEEGRLDFGDLIYRSVKLLQENSHVLNRLSSQYRHILVDEYQDINRATAMLIKLIAGDGAGLWAVGDLRQAIYRFRGASPNNLMMFEEDYPNGERISLDCNYRSLTPIVRLFERASEKMECSGHIHWKVNRKGQGTQSLRVEVSDENIEKHILARKIYECKNAGYSYNDQVVLCRKNSQCKNLADALEKEGIPVLYLGDLFSRDEVLDMLSLLTLACEGAVAGLIRLTMLPDYVVSGEELINWLQTREGSDDDRTLEMAPEGVRKIYADIEPLATKGQAYSFFARYIFGHTGYLRALLKADNVSNRQKRIGLYQLLMVAHSFTAKYGADMEDPHKAFLDHVRRLNQLGLDSRLTLPPRASHMDAVNIMTVHKSKGLEFPVVFLPNLIKGQFPSGKNSDKSLWPPDLLPEMEGDNEQEEHRLFFVALSRAKDCLIMSYSNSWNEKDTTVSSLLDLVTLAGEDELVKVEIFTESKKELEADIVDSSQSPAQLDQKPDISIGAAEQYRQCPRKYYYSYVLKLRNEKDRSPFTVFMMCLNTTIRWIREQTSLSGTVSAETAISHLQQIWDEKGPAGQAFEQYMLDRAKQILSQVCLGEALGENGEITHTSADLPNGRIWIPLDYACKTNDGHSMVEDYKISLPKAEDIRDTRLALIRHSLKAKPDITPQPVIKIRYLRTGEIVEVPEKSKLEEARVVKYDKALEGIRLREFKAVPGQQCKVCAYNIVCPL